MRILSLIALVALLEAQGLKYFTDIEAAFKQAKKAKKPLWVMVSATWCGPCKWTEKEVFPQKWFDSLITPNFIPLKVYVSSESANTPGGEELAKKYFVVAFPTYLFLYPNGEVFYAKEGGPTGKDGNDPEVRQEWEKTIQEALEYKVRFPTLRQKFEKGDRSPETVRAYFKWALKFADSATFHQAWNAYLEVFPSPRSAWLYEPGAYKYLMRAAFKLPAAETYVLEIADTLRTLLPYKNWIEIYELPIQKLLIRDLAKQTKSAPLLQACQNTIAYANQLQGRFPFAEAMALKMVVPLLFKSPKQAHDSVAFLYALHFVALKKAIEPPDPDEREELADDLNSLAWEVYENSENPVALWSAIIWAKEALAYDPEAWHIWDTLGALYYKLKRKKEAIQALSKAIELAKAQKVAEGQYQETQELLQKAQALE